MKKTIIFDFDGTIADSFDVFLELFEKVAGLERRSDQEIAHLRSLPAIKVLQHLEISLLRVPLMLREGRKMMSDRMNEIQAFNGISEAVKKLRANGYELIIMSTNATKNVNQFLRFRKLDTCIKKVYGGIGLFSKPRALKRLIRRERTRPENCIYIGDEIRDIEAARAVGVPCIAVGWGFASTASLKELNPDGFADKASELLSLIKKIEDGRAGSSWYNLSNGIPEKSGLRAWSSWAV